MSAFAEFHFLRPLWLLAALALPLAWLLTRRLRGRAGAWGGVVDAHLLPHLLDGNSAQRREGSVWLAALAWIIACAAMAGPAWQREPLPLYRNDAARLLALQLSPSMLAADIKPSRLARARYKIDDILEQSRDLQTGLIGYAGDAFVAAPVTDDVNTVRNLVAALEPSLMPVAGNATDRAIERALLLMQQSGLQSAELVILADSVSAAAAEAARNARAQGLTISVLGIGTLSGAPVPLLQGGFLQDAGGNIVLPRLQEADLRAVAAAGGGRYARMSTDRSDLETLLSDSAGASSRSAQGEAESQRFRDQGPWLLLLLLPLALLMFRRGWLMALALTLLLPAPRADAFSFTDLWLRADQQAARALADDDTERARELARDPAWRGSAAYRAEDFAEAEQAFAQGTGAGAEYNRGNALSKLGRYQEALDAYQRALDAEPDMEDARFNQQALEQWLQQQPPEQEPQSGGNDDKSQPDDTDSKQQDDSSGDSGQQSDQESESDPEQSSSESKDESGAPGQEPKPKQDDSAGDGETDDTAAEAAPADEQQQAQQQQELSKAIDEALQQQGEEGESKAMATPEQNAAHEQQQALEQWLQRVPDDPGGLLRRKFQLEYERRQRGGGNQ